MSNLTLGPNGMLYDSTGRLRGARNPVTQADNPGIGGVTTTVGASRDLTAEDNGNTLECTAGGLTLTVNTGLPAGFACTVIPSGTTSIASGGGTLLNGATSTLTRADSANVIFGIVGRASVANSYVVNGT